MNLDELIEAARKAHTLGQRAYYLGIIEARMGEGCPFTGYAFMKAHEPALQWYFMQGTRAGMRP